jgi:hypothetical protein
MKVTSELSSCVYVPTEILILQSSRYMAKEGIFGIDDLKIDK